MENQLVIAIQESGLEKTKAQVLLDNFSNYFEIASDWELKAKSLVVTSVEQRTEMKMAGEGRKFLKEKRLAVEKTRKSLKESALREGQTIDAIAKILTNLIVPIEETLGNIEKYAEIKEAERLEALKTERTAKIEEFTGFILPPLYIEKLPEDEFAQLLQLGAMKKKEKEDADAKAEKERIEKELAEKAEQERIKKENEELKKQAEAQEKAMKEAQAKADAEKKAIEEKAKKEREEAELKAREEKAKADAKLKAEQEAKAQIEAELKAKKEAEEAKERAEKAKDEAERLEAEKAKKAPRNKKLNIWVESLKMDAPEGLESDETVLEILKKFESFKVWAKSQIK